VAVMTNQLGIRSLTTAFVQIMKRPSSYAPRADVPVVRISAGGRA
jgi:hypothetical protein